MYGLMDKRSGMFNIFKPYINQTTQQGEIRVICASLKDYWKNRSIWFNIVAAPIQVNSAIHFS